MLYTLAVEIISKPQYAGALRNIMTHQNNGFEKLRCPRENSKKTAQELKYNYRSTLGLENYH